MSFGRACITIFKTASVHRLRFAKFWFFVMCPFSKSKFASAYQISLKLHVLRLRYTDFIPRTKCRFSAILNFRKLLFWSSDLCLRAILLQPSKSRGKRTTWRWDIRKTTFKAVFVRHIGFELKLIFHLVTILVINRVSVQIFIKMRWIVAKIAMDHFNGKIGNAHALYHVIS